MTWGHENGNDDKNEPKWRVLRRLGPLIVGEFQVLQLEYLELSNYEGDFANNKTKQQGSPPLFADKDISTQPQTTCPQM